jgi:hypothetical protein
MLISHTVLSAQWKLQIIANCASNLSYRPFSQMTRQVRIRRGVRENCDPVSQLRCATNRYSAVEGSESRKAEEYLLARGQMKFRVVE